MLLPYLLLFCLAVQAVSADDGDDRVFHNHFAVKVDNATSRAVDEMASKHGFRNLGQVGLFFLHWVSLKWHEKKNWRDFASIWVFREVIS